MIESLMVAERREFLSEAQRNKGNGYRPGHAYGQGKRLEFRIPRNWYGNSLRDDADYEAYMLYLNYTPEIQGMIYTINWIELINRDFRRVTRMRTAVPNEESVLTQPQDKNSDKSTKRSLI